jgi:hypothetical protein
VLLVGASGRFVVTRSCDVACVGRGGCAPLSGMRKPIVLGALVVACLAVPVTAATADPHATAATADPPATAAQPTGGSTPTCLITNGGAGGRLAKAVECVQLGADGTGTGRYSPGGDDEEHWLTVSVESEPVDGTSVAWVPMATRTVHGVGALTATADQPAATATPSATAALRACMQVGSGTTPTPTVGHICSEAGSPDVSGADVPDTDASDTDTPAADAPDTSAPDTDVSGADGAGSGA